MSLGPGKGPSAIVMAAGAVEKAQLPGIFLLAARPQAGQEMSGASWAFFKLPAVGASPAGIHTKKWERLDLQQSSLYRTKLPKN